MNLLEDLLSISKWMPPEMCTPVVWFRIFVVSCGTIVFLFYMTFVVSIRLYLRKYLRGLFRNNFSLYLKIVFFFCASNHILHSLAYIDELFKVPLLVLYPILIYAMFKLLHESFDAAKRLKYVVESDEGSLAVDNLSLSDKNKELGIKLMQVAKDRNRLHSDLRSLIISDAFHKEDFKTIKNQINDIISKTVDL